MDESALLPRVPMLVIRDGFFDGTWRVVGDPIDVDASMVETLEQAGFARRHVAPPPRETGRKAHGR
jgi:hypothetical protein